MAPLFSDGFMVPCLANQVLYPFIDRELARSREVIPKGK
ncbi:hypothetical protein Maes01_01074 [Microbulbifer aestuariivivens]|uniref:Uncharacterized protein n=1 Tax=Microbulbifer aestuariivivens TaxID=1908308 RepID=A0ABP9WMV3_9GAMM